ncbi:MAG: hypothetical protein GXO47_06560 [Chlorobi bacterium]|nr:hypothetical protein [Chlorobiota bacterium]
MNVDDIRYSICKYFIVVFVLIPFGINAQISNIRFKTISTNDGLSQSSVLSVFQDSRGFIWIGTFDGLNRYDGKDISLLSVFTNGKEEFVKGRISSLDEDNNKNLYIASQGAGLRIYNLETGILKSYTLSDSVSNSLNSNCINTVVCVDEQTVWLATSKGVTLFNPKTERFYNYYLPEVNGISEHNVTSLLLGENNELWLGTERSGLFKFIWNEERFIPYYNKSKNGGGKDKNKITSVIGYKDGLLLVTTKSGLYIFDPQTGLFFSHLVSDIELIDAVKDKNGGVWLSTAKSGLYHIDKNENLTVYENNPYDPMSFPGYSLREVYCDNMNNLWVGTMTKGVVQVNLNRKPFMNIYYVPNKPSIPDNTVYSMAEDKNDNVWIASVKGLSVWNRKDNSFKRISLNVYGKNIYNISVWSLFLDGNVLWVGTNTGLIKYNIKTGRQTHYFHRAKDPGSLIHNDITFISKDKRGNLWVSTPGGISELKRNVHRFINYTSSDNDDNSLSHNRVWESYCDSKGRLWFCTDNGLNRYDFKTGKFEVYRFSNENVLSNSLSAILETPEGDLWITSHRGIFIFDPDNAEVKGFVTHEGEFFDEHAYDLLQTDSTIWASTNNGLVVIDKKSYEIKSVYTPTDGILGKEFNTGAALKLRDGFFLFGGIEGITGFYPEKIHKSDLCPPVYFTGLALYGKDVVPENKDVWGRTRFIRSLTSASKITFTPDEKMFTLRFSALEYNYGDRVNYYYRILPISKKWIYIGKRDFVNFINLNSGSYMFQVKSTNGDGKLCNNTRTVELVIFPPFWMEWKFISFMTVILLLLISLIIKLRLSRIKREKKRLEDLVDIRTKEIQAQRNIANRQRDEIARQKEQLQDFAAELEHKVRERTRELEKAKLKAEESDRLKSAFLSNMSHEIRTPMNAIMGFSELLLTSGFDDKDRKTFARMVKANGDALLSLLNDIIDISMIESGQLRLHFSLVNVCKVVNDIFISFRNSKIYLEKNNVELVLSAGINKKLKVNVDVNRFRQIVNNLLNNALKFTDEGTVELGCEEMDDRIKFYVKDTGIGISKDMQLKIFNRFYKLGKDEKTLYGGNGLGLTITKNLIEALNGEIWVESELGKGTTFFFTIPK